MMYLFLGLVCLVGLGMIVWGSVRMVPRSVSETRVFVWQSILIVGLGLVLCIGSAVGLVIYNNYEWALYKDRYECEETGHSRERSTLQCHSTTKSQICTPVSYTEEEWACNNGKIHWR